MTSRRSRKTRFEVVVNKDDESVFIDDDDFHWDALLRVHGDFEDVAQKVRFAEAVCAALNTAADSIPCSPGSTATVSPDI